eukprot:COSAG01_NODE_2613_length_7380_cov_9.901525_3_plen_125_part_00
MEQDWVRHWCSFKFHRSLPGTGTPMSFACTAVPVGSKVAEGGLHFHLDCMRIAWAGERPRGFRFALRSCVQPCTASRQIEDGNAWTGAAGTAGVRGRLQHGRAGADVPSPEHKYVDQNSGRLTD